MTTTCPIGESGDHDQLVIPYTLEANDMRFATAPGYITGEQFFQYLKDSFDTLYAEGSGGRAKMFSIGLHCRLIGRPGKIAGLKRFLDYANRRTASGSRAASTSPAIGPPPIPTAASNAPRRWVAPGSSNASAASSNIRPGSPSAPGTLELGPAHDSAAGLHNALARMFRSASRDERLGVLRAHPDLAGKLAQARRLTRRIDRRTGLGRARRADRRRRATFQRLNDAYVAKHGFPFIIAVRDNTKASILQAFRNPHRQRHRNRIRHRLRPGGTHRRTAPEGSVAMTPITPPPAACRRRPR
jgi:OHCU decarboxylase